MNVGLYWFGETLDPTHEWDAWTLTRIGAGETLATVTPDMKFAPQLADSWEKCGPYNMEIPHPRKCKIPQWHSNDATKVKESIEYTMKQSASFCKKLLKLNLSR